MWVSVCCIWGSGHFLGHHSSWSWRWWWAQGGGTAERSRSRAKEWTVQNLGPRVQDKSDPICEFGVNFWLYFGSPKMDVGGDSITWVHDECYMVHSQHPCWDCRFEGILWVEEVLPHPNSFLPIIGYMDYQWLSYRNHYIDIIKASRHPKGWKPKGWYHTY